MENLSSRTIICKGGDNQFRAYFLHGIDLNNQRRRVRITSVITPKEIHYQNVSTTHCYEMLLYNSNSSNNSNNISNELEPTYALKKCSNENFGRIYYPCTIHTVSLNAESAFLTYNDKPNKPTMIDIYLTKKKNYKLPTIVVIKRKLSDTPFFKYLVEVK